jgi:hypothetical protein
MTFIKILSSACDVKVDVVGAFVPGIPLGPRENSVVIQDRHMQQIITKRSMAPAPAFIYGGYQRCKLVRSSNILIEEAQSYLAPISRIAQELENPLQAARRGTSS